jgi:hypothetical protein
MTLSHTMVPSSVQRSAWTAGVAGRGLLSAVLSLAQDGATPVGVVGDEASRRHVGRTRPLELCRVAE